jgi:hypothetical protein
MPGGRIRQTCSIRKVEYIARKGDHNYGYTFQLYKITGSDEAGKIFYIKESVFVPRCSRCEKKMDTMRWKGFGICFNIIFFAGILYLLFSGSGTSG